LYFSLILTKEEADFLANYDLIREYGDLDTVQDSERLSLNSSEGSQEESRSKRRNLAFEFEEGDSMSENITD
jgi:hypothetical protein